ncbi:MAG: tRNA (N(6)-L-threonylcarbamoyladenosine(37)-C(2))-methylthiotransferase MtaB, partial [Candidatus Omnitrophota bacterium]
MMKPTFTIETLGCKVNQYESQVIREALVRLGFEEADADQAEVGIVNSCTVTSKADGKTRKLVRKLKKSNPFSRIFVTGCCAVFSEDIEELESLPEVHKVVPNRDKMKLPFIIGSEYGKETDNQPVEERVSGFDLHTRAFLKVQDGCDRRCSYCKVNLVRGPSRSKDKKDVIEELVRLVGRGYKEIVITGICLGGWKGAGGEKFSDLLRDVDGLTGDFRIRLSSIEPDHIDEDLIDVISGSSRICHHLHIPLQSGSDKILKLMKREYDTGKLEELIAGIRKKIPLVGITMDVICGFPGESDEDFERTLFFIEKVRPTRLHVFSYSDRKGT